uniref:VP4 n=1 Tax=Morris orbivirus TaxID=1963252 RepID=A0A1S6PCZ8_9REOV|nr:VP4 [Morris orbivirus]
MSALSNYRGILVDSGQYRIVSSRISFKHVIHFSLPRNKEEADQYLDQLWFRIGHRSIPTIVVASKPDQILTELCNAGLLYDLRGLALPESEGGLYDLIQEISNGRTTFISKCNEIRNLLADKEEIRWCGAEAESIFNENIYTNATEICGNSVQGHYCDPLTGIHGEIPKPMNELHLRILFDRITNSFESDGQRKLGLIMCAIPRCGYNIVYVGGSPGDAWLYTLAKRNFNGTIVSIDPIPLTHSYADTLDVIEIRSMINSADELTVLLSERSLLSMKNVVFIWDVRHTDAKEMAPDCRNEHIQSEVSTLNEICNSQWFRNHVKVYQLKMNASNIDAYEMPIHSKIFSQPYTLSRDVFEMRITGHIGSPDYTLVSISANIQNQIKDYYQTLKSKIDAHDIDEYDLFINFICSIYRKCDYIDMPPLVSPKWEIALFTLNWNPPAKIMRYLDRIYHCEVKFIGSFFTGKRLTDQEYAFPEHLLLSRFPSIVFDSRALINAKLEGLYFFANEPNCALMDNELIFSESYLIGSTEYNLHAMGQMPHYDIARSIQCEKSGYIFPKFPNLFSASDNILSPSGHAMRMFIEHTYDSASLCMFAFKILSNFFRTGSGRISPALVNKLFPIVSNSWLASISPNFIPRKIRLERADDTVWHSKAEWIIGYKAGHQISNKYRDALEEAINFLEIAIHCDLKGIEIFKFRQLGWQKASAAALRLPKLKRVTGFHDMRIINIARLYTDLKKLNLQDYASWILNPSNNSKTPIWKRAVFSLSLDKYAREYFIHTAYVMTLDHTAVSHNKSGRSILELCLRAISEDNPSYLSWTRIPYILSNDFHPLHALYKSLLPDLLVRLHVMDDFIQICEILLASKRRIEESTLSSEPSLSIHYHGLALELMARNWREQYPFSRVLTHNQISNVQHMPETRSNVCRILLDDAIKLIIDPSKFYLKREVESHLSAISGRMYP